MSYESIVFFDIARLNNDRSNIETEAAREQNSSHRSINFNSISQIRLNQRREDVQMNRYENSSSTATQTKAIISSDS